MLAAAGAVVIVALVVTVWLLAIAHGAHAGTDRANARLDAVRTGLAAGAGAGAAVGLMLAFRRQHHQEISTALTDRDATERRITELYTKAVEQLGSEKAPVRLGGLYALERLAQDNAGQRQTIVNVFCAYLRMPFAPEPPGKPPEATNADGTTDTWQQERQVRLTAQRILADHLRIDRHDGQPAPEPSGPGFWPSMRLDLTGATLIDLDFTRAVAADARFDGARFTGTTHLSGTVFSGVTSFQAATFMHNAAFTQASFEGNADFRKATFAGKSWFSRAAFHKDAYFSDTSFNGNATFYKTRFSDAAEFQTTAFAGDATFLFTAFDGDAWFSASTFARRASFGSVAFKDDIVFEGVTFGGPTGFDGATFAKSSSRLLFKNSRVLAPSARHVWPEGWKVVPNGRGEYLLARDKGVSQPSDQRSPQQPLVPPD